MFDFVASLGAFSGLPNTPNANTELTNTIDAAAAMTQTFLFDGTRRAETSEQAMKWIEAYFLRAADNDFLTGRDQRNGSHANWRADIDFLLTERGRTHVIEKTAVSA